MRAHGRSLSQVRLHLNISLVIYRVEVLLEVMREVLLFHFLLEFLIESISLFVAGIGLLSKLEPRHLLIVLCEVVAPPKIDASFRARHGAADC